MENSPLVSIITPVYNGSKYIEELILSVKSQDYPYIEHIVIDDGSRDGGATVAILQKYNHLRWWSRENKGQYTTMNEGLLKANGKIVMFISADDAILPNAVETAASFLCNHPDYDGVFGSTAFIDGYGKAYVNPIPFRWAPISLNIYFAHVSHCSLYLKKESLLHDEIFFDPTLKYLGDYEWIKRLSEHEFKIGRVNKDLALVRIHENQTSQKNANSSYAEKRFVVNRGGVNKIAFFTLSNLNTLFFRLYKLIVILIDTGLVGIIDRLIRWRIRIKR